MIKSELLYIDHIISAIVAIESFVKGYSDSDFSKDKMRYDAILHNLQTMAESTQRLSEKTKTKYSHIAWRDISGFRNILVHEYLEGIDPEIIWSIITNELSILKEAMLIEANQCKQKE